MREQVKSFSVDIAVSASSQFSVAVDEREREATLNNQHSDNKLNVTCGRVPEKANAQLAGHLINKSIRNKHNIHNYTY